MREGEMREKVEEACVCRDSEVDREIARLGRLS
jgi:hypothetical protein